MTLFNRSVATFNRLSSNDSTGEEHGTFNFISTGAPDAVVDHSNERVGRDSALESESESSFEGPSDAEREVLSSQKIRSARELLVTALDKLSHCVDVLTNIVDRLNPEWMEGKADLTPRNTKISSHVRRVRHEKETGVSAKVVNRAVSQAS